MSERKLLDALFSGHAKLVDPVEDHMDAPLPSIGSNEPVSEAVHALEGADAGITTAAVCPNSSLRSSSVRIAGWPKFGLTSFARA